jgi:hypothetical protein
MNNMDEECKRNVQLSDIEIYALMMPGHHGFT